MEGKVKWYSQEKGYGFVEGNDGGDYFVHHTQVPQDLHLDEGVDVEFEAAETDRGSQARNVRAPGAAPAAATEDAPAEDAAEEVADEPAEEPAEEAAPVDEEAVEEAAEEAPAEEPAAEPAEEEKKEK